MTRTVVHFSDSRQFGGTEQIVLQLLAGLDRQRWRPILMHQPAPGVAALVNGARSLGIERVPASSFGGMKGLVRIPQLVRQFRSIRPAVVHAHLTDPLACKFGLIAASLARVPVVVATAQLFMESRGRAVRAQHRVVTAGVDRYIAVSAEVASQLRRRFGVDERKLRVVHNSTTVDRYMSDASAGSRHALTGGADQRVVLTVARLDRQKGHRCLIEAAAAVPNALFIFAGDGAERAALEREARGRGVAERVRFLGHRDDVPNLLASCDLFVLPSLYEGLPLAVLEAMAAGKPVVATAIGGTDEAVVDGVTGLLVPPSNPAALAGAIRRVLGDDALGRRLGAAGRVRASTCFSSAAMVAQVADVYDELLN
jgi:glycosyltransferase involved in cell wall biosynthesis